MPAEKAQKTAASQKMRPQYKVFYELLVRVFIAFVYTHINGEDIVSGT